MAWVDYITKRKSVNRRRLSAPDGVSLINTNKYEKEKPVGVFYDPTVFSNQYR